MTVFGNLFYFSSNIIINYSISGYSIQMKEFKNIQHDGN